MSSSSLAKIWFIISVGALGVAYGVAAQQWGWFPSSQARQAFLQIEKLGWVKSSLYTHRAVYERRGTRILEPQKMQPGVTAVSSWWEGSTGRKYGLKLIDKNGKVLHEWWVDRGKLFQDYSSQRKSPLESQFSAFEVLPDGGVVATLSYVGLIRLNSCGKVLWTLPIGAHHSVVRAEDGSFWVSGVSQKRKKSSKRYPKGFKGLSSVWLDQVVHVSKEGKILDKINVLDIIYQNNLSRLLFQHKQTSGDVTHLNDVEPLGSKMADEYPLFKAGDLLVSLRNINMVFVFNPKSGDIKWYADGPFIRQHDPDFIGEGWIGVFDNNWRRGKVRGGSKIIGFKPHDDSTKVLFQPKYLDRFYTIHKGDWTKLENGNMLLTESAAGRVVEVSPKGNLVWEWVHESYDSGIFEPYDSMVPAVPVAKRYSFSSEEVASWPCSTVDSNRN